MSTCKTPENFWNFLCSQGFFQYNICSEGSSAQIFKVVIIKINNSGVPSPSSPQSLICISLLHLPAPLLAVLDYYFMSGHWQKMILVKSIRGVKLSMGALWEFASLESKTAPSSRHFQRSSQDFVFHIPLSDLFPISQSLPLTHSSFLRLSECDFPDFWDQSTSAAQSSIKTLRDVLSFFWALLSLSDKHGKRMIYTK